MSQFPTNPMYPGDSLRGQDSGSGGHAFEKITIYDKPSVFLGQLFDHEASMKTLHDTFLAPNNLTPSERRTLADRLAGPNANHFEKAVLGVVTNPFVWLMFLTSPVGSKALAEGKSLFSVKQKYAAQQWRSLSWATQAMSPLQVMDGTAANGIATGVSEPISLMGLEAARELDPLRARVLKSFNEKLGLAEGSKDYLTTLNRDELLNMGVKKSDPRYQLLAKMDRVVGVRAHKLDQDWIEEIPQLEHEILERKDGGDWAVRDVGDAFRGKSAPVRAMASSLKEDAAAYNKSLRDAWYAGEIDRARYGNDVENLLQERGREVSIKSTIKYTEVPRTAKFDSQTIAQEVDELGPEAFEYLEAANLQRRKFLVRHLGDDAHFDATGNFKVDERKAKRIAAAMNREFHGSTGDGWTDLNKGASSLQGKEALLQIIGDSHFERAMSIEDTIERSQYISHKIGEFLGDREWNPGEWWLPRNTYTVQEVQAAGKLHRPMTAGPENAALDTANLEHAPWSASTVMHNRVVPVTAKDLFLDRETLEEGAHALTDDGLKHLEDVGRRAQNAFDNENGRATMGLRFNHEAAHQRYVRNMNEGYVYDVMPATDAMIAADSAAIKNIPPERHNNWTELGPGLKVSITEDLSQLAPEARANITAGALIDRTYMGLHEAVRPYVRSTLVPAMLSNGGPEYLALYNSQVHSKEIANWFSKSAIGNMVRGFGAPGAKFMAKVDEVADWSNPAHVQDWSHGLARWFYASHLGVNLASMVTNLTQPLLLAATAGTLPEVLGAYKDSFLDMADYAKKRAALGAKFLDPATKLGLMHDSFPMMGRATEGMNMLGIGPDSAALTDHLLHRSPGMLGRVEEVMMKGFEKTEWMNRNTAAHLFKRISARAETVNGIVNANKLADMKRFVLETQFGGDALNTPGMFTKGVLANPLLRQFFTFPLRSAVGAFHVFPRLGEESYVKGLMNTTLRGMGMSAIMYETGKGLLGVDMSRGLYADATTAIVGGDRIADKDKSWVPLPPVVDVPISMFRGALGGDGPLFASSVARLVPGGVAINRALGLVPDAREVPVVGGFQKTFADWANPGPDGKVGIYKGDGTLIEFRSPAEIVAKGLGVDLGTWDKQGGLDNYLVKQRDQIIQYRQSYLQALASNDVGRAQEVQREFLQRFKLPLTVTKQQISTFFANRTQGRTERVLGRIPQELRGPYQSYAEDSGAGGNLGGTGLREGTTARDRDANRVGGSVDARVEEVLRRESAVGPGAVSPGPFSAFPGYTRG